VAYTRYRNVEEDSKIKETLSCGVEQNIPFHVQPLSTHLAILAIQSSMHNPSIHPSIHPSTLAFKAMPSLRAFRISHKPKPNQTQTPNQTTSRYATQLNAKPRSLPACLHADHVCVYHV